MKADYPVVAIDSYCPIVDPISAKVQGYLAVLLALGNCTQVNMGSNNIEFLVVSNYT